MSEPFLGEIKIFSFAFAPRQWALCNGQLLPINQNQGLFSLLGTTYGGNGMTTFALPNLQARTPIHTGEGHTLGEMGGEQAHTLSVSELPTHAHVLQGANVEGSTDNPAGAALAGTRAQLYAPSTDVSLGASSISNVGGSQAHLNLQPFLTLNFCIALVGIFPSP